MTSRTAEQTSEIMRRVRSRDTTPELMLRKALRERGLRYRTSATKLPGKPDIVIPAERLAIFVDGDFWHGHQWRKRGFGSLFEQFQDRANGGYWTEKISRNVRRDFAATLALMEAGWTVLRFWESDISDRLEECVDVVMKAKSSGKMKRSRSVFPSPTAAEFFAGIGLMRFALERQGWSVRFANDIDPDKLEIYGQNFAVDDFNLGDIKAIDPADVPDVTLATASFPCNDLSLAGKGKGLAGDHSSTFWAFANILEGMGGRRPPLILVENVPGFLNSRKGADLADALRRLNSLGYACDLLMVNAAAFVPQSRARLFIVGVQDARSVTTVAREEIRESAASPGKIVDFISRHPEIDWCIRPLPSPPTADAELADIVEDLPDSAPEWWSDERADYLMGQMSERHTKTASALIARRSYTFATVFRRVRHGKSMAELRTDGLAGCLRTPRGGSGRQIVVRLGRGKYRVRLMTPRECARLIGVPDTFRCDVPVNQALFGFGDAVCVPAIEWILQSHIQPLIEEMMRGVALSGA
jgi:DNA (cytosine-5)-methyltransferase 1